MKWDDAEFIEAIRLIRKFFPESRSVVSSELGLRWDDFLGVMLQADWGEDLSCDPFCPTTTPEMVLAKNGGIDGSEAEVFDRLMDLSGFSPSGRVVVIPDTLGRGGSVDDRLPFVCAAGTLRDRLEEIDGSDELRYVFGWGGDTLLVFESGEVLLVDHDERFFWAKSKLRAFEGMVK